MKCILDAWDAHHGELLRFAAGRLRDFQDARDLVQEVFLRASRLERGLCGIENRRAWLFQVARNLLIDHYRRSRLEIPLEADVGELAAELAERVAPVTDAAAAPATKTVAETIARAATEAAAEAAPVEQLSQCLPRVLSELSPADREALTLCDIEGLSQQALAARLGLSLPAAKSRLQRARKRLRAQLVQACQVQFDAAGHVCCFVPRPPLEK